jgi:hypothetical protein
MHISIRQQWASNHNSSSFTVLDELTSIGEDILCCFILSFLPRCKTQDRLRQKEHQGLRRKIIQMGNINLLDIPLK